MIKQVHDDFTQKQNPAIAQVHIAILLFIIASIFLVFHLNDVKTNGDSYLFARSITNFEGPVFHFGYYVMGHLLQLIFANFGISPLTIIGIMSVIFGSLSVVLMFLISFKLTKNWLISILSPLILLFAGDFWFYSVHGEVYIPQFSFIMLTIFLILHKRMIIASFTFLLAVSITPTSIIAVFGFIYLMYLIKSTSREKWLFISPLLLAAALLLFLYYTEVIVLVKWFIYSPAVFVDNFSLLSVSKYLLVRLAKVYLKSFHVLLIFVIFGTVVLYKNNKQLLILGSLFLLPFVSYIFNLGLISGDHLIITFFPVSFFCAYGFYYLVEQLNVVKYKEFALYSFFLALHFFLLVVFSINREQHKSRDLIFIANKLNKRFVDNSILISNYSFGMAFWYLTQNEDNRYIYTGRPVSYILQNKATDKDKLDFKFWISLPNIFSYLSYEHQSEYLLENRSVFLVMSNPPLPYIFKFTNSLLNTKRLQRSGRMNRFSKFLEGQLLVKMKYEQLEASDWYTIYQIYPEEQKVPKTY
jgi:hypothetical protein